ncbi:DUF3737 family protein [Clostridium felsineum]|uniref:DUF3737 family protein n=1 Tax=Clostridium felsineum TaxID=36839 RepID=UPI00098CB737|nr:DUF3737 family protein [Clostridium felsineum]URZ17497.1 hypothetical protein CLFE_035500 [Clostridium felsineum DSM 794]
MNVIEKEIFEGERPLYKSFDVLIKECEFLPGESAIKESRNIKAINCNFKDKYPFWHNNKVEIQDCYFSEDSRAAIWYTSDLLMNNCKVDAPKIFRDGENITITNTVMDTEETLWDCKNVKIVDSEFKGNYLLLHGENIELTNFKLDGNYSFQHVKGGIVRNCVIKSKDAFWNTENITVYDSVLEGEYLAWYSKNLKLVNCTIIGTQPLCYAENLILENCKMINTDLCFEYTSVQADVTTIIDSVKNPTSGVIKAEGIKELILDDPKLDHSKTEIITKA